MSIRTKEKDSCDSDSDEDKEEKNILGDILKKHPKPKWFELSTIVWIY